MLPLKNGWKNCEFSVEFGIYDTKKFNQYFVDALLQNEMPEPAKYVGTPVYKSNLQTNNDGWWLQDTLVQHQCQEPIIH